MAEWNIADDEDGGGGNDFWASRAPRSRRRRKLSAGSGTSPSLRASALAQAVTQDARPRDVEAAHALAALKGRCVLDRVHNGGRDPGRARRRGKEPVPEPVCIIQQHLLHTVLYY